MSLLRLVLVSSFVTFSIACSGSNYSTPSTPSPSPAQNPGGPSSSVTIPAGAEVLGNRAYAPDDVTVTVGATVTWTNSDRVAHTSTADAGAWNSGTVAPGGQFSRVFDTTGTFAYHCTIHPGMVGTVVVR